MQKKYLPHSYLAGVRLLCPSEFYFPFYFIFDVGICLFIFRSNYIVSNLLCSSFVNQYMFEVLSAKDIIFFEIWINFVSSWSVVWKALLAFLNLMTFTTAIKSFSNAEIYLTCFGECNLFSPYLFAFPFYLHPVSYMIAFHLILFISILIFSTNCNLQFLWQGIVIISVK